MYVHRRRRCTAMDTTVAPLWRNTKPFKLLSVYSPKPTGRRRRRRLALCACKIFRVLLYVKMRRTSLRKTENRSDFVRTKILKRPPLIVNRTATRPEKGDFRDKFYDRFQNTFKKTAENQGRWMMNNGFFTESLLFVFQRARYWML